MKKFLNLLLVFIVAFGYAQLAPFTITATKVSDETCPSNGAISWTTSGTTAGSTLTYSIVNTATNIPVDQTSASSFAGLVAGSYKIVATQTLGQQSNQATSANINITNQKQTLAYTIYKNSDEVCGHDGQITVNVSSGRSPYRYQIISTTDASVITDNGNNNVFSALIAGTYRIRVIDACGSALVKDVQIVNAPSNFGYFYSYFDYSDCNYLTVTLSPGSNPKFPISYTISYTNPITGQAESVSGNTSAPPKIPNFLTVNTLPITVTATDACGKVVTQNSTLNYKQIIVGSSLQGSCGRNYFSISQLINVNYQRNVPFKVTFTSAPAGFDPAVYDTNNANFATQHTFGSATNPPPAGTYAYSVKDICGRDLGTYTYTLTAATPFLNFSNFTECDGSSITPNFFLQNQFYMKDFMVTAAPQAFINLYGPVPYQLPASNYVLDSNGNRTNAIMNHLPAGNYTVQVTNTCDATVTTRSFTFTPTPIAVAPTTVAVSCTGQFTFSQTGAPTDTYAYLQKYFPAEGKWGVSPSALYTPGSGLQANMWGAFAANTITTVPGGPGKYRLIRYQVYYPVANGTASVNTFFCDPIVLAEFSVGDPLVMTNAYAFQCADGTYDVAISASEGSVTNLKYAIVSDGTSSATVIKDNGTNPVFHGVAGGSYFFRVMDDCGNFVTRKLDIAQLGKPGISIVSDCSTSPASLKLQVNGLDYLSYEWYNTSNPSTILSTSPVLDLGPFDSSKAGTYAVHMRSASSGSCINQTEIMTLSPTALTNAQAGTGQTVNLAYNGTTPSVDLFSYLTGPYDGYGTWTETTVPSSSLLTGHYWNAAAAAPGTYTFRYTVTPPCGGTPSSTTVTINLSKLCYRLPVTTGGTVKDTNFGITALQRAGAKDASQWPMIRKGGWMALEANGKGFVVNRVAFDSNNLPVGIPQANFVAGMMVYDTTNKCLKIYNGTVWSCYTTQTCPN